MRAIIPIGLVAVMLLLLSHAGCNEPAVLGVVDPAGALDVGQKAPDIPFRTLEGKETTFNAVREQIAVVVFFSPGKGACCMLDPRLVNLYERFETLPVTVAQISLPSKDCPHGPGCGQACGIGTMNVVGLCDKDLVAYKSYGEPKLGTAYLVDDLNRIVVIGTIDNLGPLADRAYELARGIQQEHVGEEIGFVGY